MQEQTGFTVPGFEVPAWAGITPLDPTPEPTFSDAARAEQQGFAAPGFESPEVTAAQAAREALEAIANDELTLYTAANGRFTQATSADGELGKGGKVGRWFGQHRADELAIRKAIHCAAKYCEKHKLGAVKLTVKTAAPGFAAAGKVGTKFDDGQGGKTREIGRYAMRHGVVLTIARLAADEPNPAAEEVAMLTAIVSEHEAEMRAGRASK